MVKNPLRKRAVGGGGASVGCLDVGRFILILKWNMREVCDGQTGADAESFSFMYDLVIGTIILYVYAILYFCYNMITLHIHYYIGTYNFAYHVQYLHTYMNICSSLTPVYSAHSTITPSTLELILIVSSGSPWAVGIHYTHMSTRSQTS